MLKKFQEEPANANKVDWVSIPYDCVADIVPKEKDENGQVIQIGSKPKYYIFVKQIINENPVENSNELYEKLYSNLFPSQSNTIISYCLTANSVGIHFKTSGYFFINFSKSSSIFLLPIKEFIIFNSNLCISALIYIVSK